MNGDLAPHLRYVNIRYRTDWERIRRILPPPLEADDIAEVGMDWLVIWVDKQFEGVFVPGPYHEAGIFVSCRYRGRSGMLEIGMPLTQDWGRHKGREFQNLTKKDGIITIDREGDTVRASLTRRGKLLNRIETVVTDKPSHPMFWIRECAWGGFRYRYALNPDWRQGLLGVPKVELWRLGGRESGYPKEMIERESTPLACNVSQTKLELVDPSPLDAFCELPVLEILGVSYYDGVLGVGRRTSEGNQAISGSEANHEMLEAFDATIFEPWALFKYDRPISKSIVQVPDGWPEKATAFKMSEPEIQVWRAREALVLEPVNVVNIEYEVDSATHARTLPPECQSGDKPLIRILALNAERSDISILPFSELWLFSRCKVNDQPAWYALANIVGQEGDSFFGRETLGYPSKRGDIHLEITEKEFRIIGHRLGRDFLLASGQLSGRRIQRPEEQFDIVGLQAYPLGGQEMRIKARLVRQPWSLWLNSAVSVADEGLSLDMPETTSHGVIGRRDPWFELVPRGAIEVIVGRGSMKRMPGTYVGEVTNYEPYFLHRYDGCPGATEALQGGGKDTFLIG